MIGGKQKATHLVCVSVSVWLRTKNPDLVTREAGLLPHRRWTGTTCGSPAADDNFSLYILCIWRRQSVAESSSSSWLPQSAASCSGQSSLLASNTNATQATYTTYTTNTTGPAMLVRDPVGFQRLVGGTRCESGIRTPSWRRDTWR